MMQRKITIVTGIVAIIAVVVVVGLMDWGMGCSPKPTPSSVSQGVPFQPIVITGSGSKTTAPFLITTDEWIIDWSYVPEDNDYDPVFSAFIHRRSDGAVYGGIVASKHETSGSTYSYAGPGEYYIETNVMNIKSWKITIRPA